MTGALLLVAGVGLALIGGTLLATLLALRDPLDWALGVLVLAAVHVVLVSVVVGGLAHAYRPGPVLATSAAVDGVLAVAAWPRRADARGVLAPIAGAAAVVRALRPWQAIVCALALVALAWRLALAALLPPFAYDALVYHLTAVADWVQHRRIEVNPYALCCGHYPSNAELLFGWPALLMHRDTLVDAVQVVSAVVGALAVAGLGRLAGLTPAGCLTAAALFVLTPVVLVQANVDYNDLTVAAFLLAALYFVARTFEASPFAFTSMRGGRLEPGLLLVGAAATGFVLGAKLDGFFAAGVVAVLVAGQFAAAAARGRLRTGRALASVGAFVGVALVLGGWWYVRNWLDDGNPFWPYRVTLLGHELFAGPLSMHAYFTPPPNPTGDPILDIGRSWFRDVRFVGRDSYSYESRSGGLGPLWSYLGWPCAAWLVWLGARRRRALLVSFLLPLALVELLQPYRWWSRFTIPLAAVGAVAVVAVVELARREPVRRALVAAALVLATCGAALATWRLNPAGLGRELSVPQVVRAAEDGRSGSVGRLFFDEYRWLDGVPRRATIAVEVEAPPIRWIYPLFGSHLDRRLVLLEPDERRGLRRRLDGPGPLYLAVGAGSWYDHWARARPGAFRRIFDVRGVRVYRKTA